MKKYVYFLILIIFLVPSEKSYGQSNNKIIIKVGNNIITNYELKNKILSNLILANQTINQQNINKIKKQSVDLLIQKKLKEIELSRYNFKNDEERVKKYLKSISSDNISDLKQKFKNNNINFEIFVEDIQIQFKWQKLIIETYSKKIDISEENISKEINKILNKKQNFTEFKLSEIEIPINNDETDKKKLSELKELIKEISFEDAALKFSISPTAERKGDLGWISSNSLSQKILNIIIKLEIGEISETISKQGSATIFKLVDKRKSNVNNLDVENLRKNLINNKKNELFNLYSQSLLSKLKNTTLIEYLNE